jgi:hypothetical protein
VCASTATPAPRSQWSKASLSRDTGVIAFSFQIEPHVVLEVAPEASLQEIHDAYRRQAKKFHPDSGGTDWAFRILAQAYEVLSTARVERASRTGSESESPFAPPRPQPSATETRRNGGAKGPIDPKRRVGVEKLWVRYEAEPLWLRHDLSPDDHSLSCSINFKWPDPTSERVPVEPAEVERILGQLAGVFESMCVKTSVVTSRIRVNENSFTGWLSYSSVERASAAYRLLHGILTGLEFGVNQWNRDLLIPRTWQ